jgi:hypothetical protein
MGMGFAYPTLTLLALKDAPEGAEGTISSAALLAGSIGMAAGVTLCGLPVTIAHAYGRPLPWALVATFAIAFVEGLALLAVTPRLETKAAAP